MKNVLLVLCEQHAPLEMLDYRIMGLSFIRIMGLSFQVTTTDTLFGFLAIFVKKKNQAV